MVRTDYTAEYSARLVQKRGRADTQHTEVRRKLQQKRQLVAEHHLRLVWDLPTPYSRFHPVALELAEETKDTGVVTDGAGKAWIYVEPDGDVLRGQGRVQVVLGNLIKDSWETVWAAAKN